MVPGLHAPLTRTTSWWELKWELESEAQNHSKWSTYIGIHTRAFTKFVQKLAAMGFCLSHSLRDKAGQGRARLNIMA